MGKWRSNFILNQPDSNSALHISCWMRPPHRLLQPLFVLSSGILHAHHNNNNKYIIIYTYKRSCISPCAVSCFEAPSICGRFYVIVLEVSDKFPGNDTLHELSHRVMHCNDSRYPFSRARGCLFAQYLFSFIGVISVAHFVWSAEVRLGPSLD